MHWIMDENSLAGVCGTRCHMSFMALARRIQLHYLGLSEPMLLPFFFIRANFQESWVACLFDLELHANFSFMPWTSST